MSYSEIKSESQLVRTTYISYFNKDRGGRFHIWFAGLLAISWRTETDWNPLSIIFPVLHLEAAHKDGLKCRHHHLLSGSGFRVGLRLLKCGRGDTGKKRRRNGERLL
jgi:hypothetical protein